MSAVPAAVQERVPSLGEAEPRELGLFPFDPLVDGVGAEQLAAPRAQLVLDRLLARRWLFRFVG
jgi:hypothetical protein